MENEQDANESSDRAWRSQNFRDGITNQIKQAVIHCGPQQPQAKNARDLETRAYSRSSSKAEYMDFVGQVIIRLNVVGNGNRAIGAPALYDAHDDEAIRIPSGPRNKSIKYTDSNGREHGVNSFEATLTHKVGLGAHRPNMNTASSLNAKEEEKPVEIEASRDTKGEGKEMKINSERDRMWCGGDDVTEYLHRLIREDKKKQIQENEDCFKGDEDFEEKRRAIDKFMDKCLVQTSRPPPYLCDQWTHEIYKDPVITPSGFTYERSGIEDHLKNVGEFDPMTRVKLTTDLLIPNHAMKKLVDAYLSAKPDGAMQSGCSASKHLRGSDHTDD